MQFIKAFLFTYFILFSGILFGHNYIIKDTNRASIIASRLLLKTIYGLYSLGVELPLTAEYLFRIDKINNNPLKILIFDKIFTYEDSLIKIFYLIWNRGYEYTIIVIELIINELFESHYDVNNISDEAIIDKLEGYL